jgi:hypothetical protein
MLLGRQEGGLAQVLCDGEHTIELGEKSVGVVQRIAKAARGRECLIQSGSDVPVCISL